MKVCVAQTKPVVGDIQHNVVAHRRLVDLAVSNDAEIIVFPELSVTGYEPTLAKDLATHLDDHRFDILQAISDMDDITIGIGVPTKHRDGIRVSSLLFHPSTPRQPYSKTHLHQDEECYFVSGQPSLGLLGKESSAALAICYELSVPEHAANAHRNGASIYIASVAKSVGQIGEALKRLREISTEYSMTVLMSNCIGLSEDGVEWAGRTSVWDNKGTLLSQLDDANEGIIVVDTGMHAVARRTI